MLAFLTTGGYEWIVILIVALLLFGRRLPEVMRSMGQGLRQFKKGLQDVEDNVKGAAQVGESHEPRQLNQGDSDEPSSPAG